jgi:hypothetical protein
VLAFTPARRRVPGLLAAEHAALLVLLGSGAALMARHGWGFGHFRWLALKLGLVALLVVPLEGFHAYIGHVWIPRAERRRKRRVAQRGAALLQMIRTIAVPLFGVAVPLIAWLSFRRPF